MDNHSTVSDIVLKVEEIEWVPFTVPGLTGTAIAAYINMDAERAPFIALAKMAPQANLQGHYLKLEH